MLVAALEAGLDLASGLHIRLDSIPAIAQAARIWRSFMTSALPRLKVSDIPGGQPLIDTPASGDPIGDLLEGASSTPAPPAPPASQPANKGPAPEFF